MNPREWPAYRAALNVILRRIGADPSNLPDEPPASLDDAVAACDVQVRAEPGRRPPAGHGPVLAREAPVVVLPGRRGPRAFDPVTGARVSVDDLGGGFWAFDRRLPHRGPTGWRLLRFALRGGRRLLALTTGAGLLSAMLTFATPIGSLAVIGAMEEGRPRLVLWYGAALLALLALGALTGLVRDRAATRLQSHLQTTAEPAVWDRLLRLDLPFFRQHPVRRLLRHAQGVGQLRGLLGSGGLDALLGAIFTAIALTLLSLLDPWLGVAGLALAGAVLAALAWLAWRQQRHDQVVYESVDDVQAVMYPALLGIDEIHAYGAEATVLERWRTSFDRQKSADDTGLRYAEISAALIAGVQPAFLATMLPIAAWTGSGTAAYWVIVIAAVQLTLALSRLHSVLQLVFSVGPVHARLRPILTAAPEVPPGRKRPGRLSGAIELRNVAFAYPGSDDRVLDGIDLTIEPGEFVAITGPSGAGKSTLLRLILGLDRPVSGAVLLDGQDLAELDVQAVREQIGYVPQQGTAPRGTVRSLILGDPLSDDDARAWEAAELAGIAADLRALPMGLDTIISDGDAGFSGGQLQRLLIARALAKRPRILLLDEATSALDNRVQSEVAEAIAHLGVTRVVVAHRLSTIRNADRVLVISAGGLHQAKGAAARSGEPGAASGASSPAGRVTRTSTPTHEESR